MSLKEAIVLWNEGVNKALDGKFEEAISVWNSMQESGARISFNIASMYILLGNLEKAEKVRCALSKVQWEIFDRVPSENLTNVLKKMTRLLTPLP